jgi:hypothetical protein
MTKNALTIKGKEAFLLKTNANYELPDDLLLKTAFSWGEAVDIYFNSRDENWIAVKYEDLIFDTSTAVLSLFEFLGIEDEVNYNKAILIPRKNKSEYYLIKRLFKKTKFKSEVIDALKRGCDHFDYPISPLSIEGNASSYYSEKFKTTMKKLHGRLWKHS